MSAAQLDGALLESGSFDDSPLGDREARYEFKRHLIRRLQAATRGMQRSERFQRHQTFIQEWRALQDNHEALSHLPLIAWLLDGGVTATPESEPVVSARQIPSLNLPVLNAEHGPGVSPVADRVPVQLSVLSS